MKLKATFTSVCLLVAMPVLLIAGGRPPGVKWTVNNPFEFKVLIENKGQYELTDKGLAASDIYFGANLDGLQYYFTKNAIWIQNDSVIKRSEQETEKLKAQRGVSGNTDNDLNLLYKVVTEFHQMYFQGANPDVQISGVNEVSNSFNFGIRDRENVAIHAQGYKKIVYANLYPGIDMEFYFPDNKQGFEYDFIVHPSADISQIKIQYPLNKGLTINNDGNMVINSVFGGFIDHAPVASQAQVPNAVPCSFALENGIVQFNVGNYDKSKFLTIDPWTVPNPIFGTSNLNAGYYVDADDGGNCYVFGGGGKKYGTSGAKIQWTLNKYDQNGTLLYSYQENFPDTSLFYMGHFAVDRITQSAYIVEGFNTTGTGAIMLKLDKHLNLVKQTTSGANMEAMWRIAFSRCNPHQAVVGGGNDNKNAPFYNAFTVDTTLNTVIPVNASGSASGFHGVSLLALDNSNNAYMNINTSAYNNNAMIRVPIPALTPTAWNITDNYKFANAISVYIGGAFPIPNGFSGMSYSTGNDLFTYNAYKLEKWNSATGALVATKTLNSSAIGDSTMYWAGLSADVCDNVFVGSLNKILQFDGNLNQVNSFATPNNDTIYDVKIGNHNIVYACGNGFVEAINVNLAFCVPFTADTTIVNATCTQKGRASVVPKNGTAPYRVTWTALGSTTVISDSLAADSLEAGTYILNVLDTSCMPQLISDTFQVKRIATFPTVSNPSTHICLGQTATLTTVGTATSYTWSPSTTLSASTGASVTANPTTTTTYTLVGFAAGECPDTVYPVVVTVDTLPTITVSPNPAAICTGSSINLTGNGASTYSWTPVGTGISPTTGTTVAASPTITSTYTITGTDGNGCIDSSSFTVTVNPYPVVAFVPDTETICTGKSTNLTATGATTYTWQNNPAGLSDTTSGGTATASPAATTTYAVYGTTNGCTTKALDTVTVLPAPNVSIKALQPTICVDAPPLVLNGYGSPGGGVFSGNGITNGVPDTTFNPATAGAGGPYTIKYTYTSPNGCVNSDSGSITVAPLPNITILPKNPVVCSSQNGNKVSPAVLTASGAVIYSWNPSTNLTINDSVADATPPSPTRYTVTGTDANGCMDTASVLVNIGALPNVAFSILVPNSCNPLQLEFSASLFDTSVAYLWEFGDKTTGTGLNTQHTYTIGKLDTIKLIEINSQGCIDSLDTTQQVEALTEIAVLPNAFAPDGIEVQNGFFGPHINCNSSGYLFRIYNRWGQMVYQSGNGSDPGWMADF